MNYKKSEQTPNAEVSGPPPVAPQTERDRRVRCTELLAIMPILPETQMDDCNVICPHCLHAYQAEAGDYEEQEREEECENCGGRYMLHDEATVTHYTRPLANDPKLSDGGGLA